MVGLIARSTDYKPDCDTSRDQYKRELEPEKQMPFVDPRQSVVGCRMTKFEKIEKENPMTLKDLLVHVDNSKTSKGRVAMAIQLAQTYGAHLTGIYVMPHFEIPVYAEVQIRLREKGIMIIDLNQRRE